MTAASAPVSLAPTFSNTARAVRGETVNASRDSPREEAAALSSPTMSFAEW